MSFDMTLLNWDKEKSLKKHVVNQRNITAVLFLNGKSCSSQTGPVYAEGSEERGTSKRNRETRVRLILNQL